MKISIIIPVYNGEKFIESTILSVLNQTYKDYEIIIVNDASTDLTSNVIGKYRQQIATEIINRENLGISKTVNKGIKAMKGDWFKWLSADDELKPDYLQTMVDKIKETENPKNKIFVTNYDIINQYGKELRKFTEPDINSWSQDDRNALLVSKYYGNISSSIFHKDIFKNGMFAETMRHGEDYEFWLRNCLVHDVQLVLVPEYLIRYREHPMQTTQQKKIEIMKQTEQMRDHILSQLSHEERNFYKKRAKELDKKPTSVKLRKSGRNIMIKILPKNISMKIINTYLKRKKTMCESCGMGCCAYCSMDDCTCHANPTDDISRQIHEKLKAMQK